jgi:proprotein convertase subtilisin/kexin type 5
VVTDKSAYKLCVFTLNENRDDCIDQCPEGQSLILDPINNNHCGEENKCEKYLFKPLDYCIDECNTTFYAIQNETICGLCKYINETHPYKIINQNFCIKEKPNNTYFIDEGKKLLNYCHSSCETCYGENENQCLSCKNGYMVINGKCSDKCPDGYYKDSNGACQQCNSNCLTCEGPSINDNNNCSSCDLNKSESYLIDAEGFPHNCVSECPNNTILNGNKTKCVKNNSEDTIHSGDKLKKEGTSYLIYIIITLIIIILIVLGFILFQKYRSKREDDEKLIADINNGINYNILKEKD